MSANNQTLIQKHNGKYLVFENIMAESWDTVNTLEESKAVYKADTFEEAYEKAEEIEEEEPTEYGIANEVLRKDVTRITII